MRQSLIQKISIAGRDYLESPELGIKPLFTRDIRRRVRQQKAVNIVVCGEAGEGKSLTGIQICQSIDPTFGKLDSPYAKLDPEYGLPQIVFTYEQYLKVLLKMGRGHPILFDEPSYSMGKREWFNQVNKALVKTIESQRFMVKPLIIPIINTSLLDKTIRSYLIQYMVHIRTRGKGVVYRLSASQFQDKVYKNTLCRIRYGLLDHDKCDKTSCMGCRKREGCQLLRARYVKKKASIQLDRYEQDLEETMAMKGTELTLEQIANYVLPLKEQFYVEGEFNVTRMKLLLRTEFGIIVSRNKSYDVKELLLQKHLEPFPTINTE